MKGRHTYTRRLILVLTMLCALSALAYFCLRNNIHTVIPGQVYRSAQLNAPMFSQVIHQYKIKSIINLRGENPSFPDYQAEINAAKQNHVQHYDVRLNAYILPQLAQFYLLIGVLQNAPRPILIHCLNGADRTGLASAIALELNGVDNLQQVKQQFSLFYLVVSPHSVGKQVFAFYENWLLKNNLSNSKENFLRWAYSPNPFRG